MPSNAFKSIRFLCETVFADRAKDNVLSSVGAIPAFLNSLSKEELEKLIVEKDEKGNDIWRYIFTSSLQLRDIEDIFMFDAINLGNLVNKQNIFSSVAFTDDKQKKNLFANLFYVSVLIGDKKAFDFFIKQENIIDINAKSYEDGANILHMSVKYNRFDMFNDIYKKEPSLLISSDNVGISPFSYALLNQDEGFPNFFKKLLDKMEYQEHMKAQAFCLLNMISDADQVLNDKLIWSVVSAVSVLEDQKKTALHYLITDNAKPSVIKLLLKYADIKAQDSNKSTPLHYVIINNNIAVIKLLLQQAISTNVSILNIKDSNGLTPLHLLAQSTIMDDEIFSLLQQPNLGLDLSVKDQVGATPLHYAGLSGNDSMLSVLIMIGINQKTLSKVIDITDNKKATPLHYASSIKHENSGIIQPLISKKNINKQDKHGNTPLHYASAKSSVAEVSILLDEGAKFDIKNKNKHTPLHCAELSHANKQFSADIIDVLQTKISNNVVRQQQI